MNWEEERELLHQHVRETAELLFRLQTGNMKEVEKQISIITQIAHDLDYDTATLTERVVGHQIHAKGTGTIKAFAKDEKWKWEE